MKSNRNFFIHNVDTVRIIWQQALFKVDLGESSNFIVS